MARSLRLARPFLVLVLLFAAIRFSLKPFFGVAYENGRAQSISIVVLTLTGAAFYGVFLRRFMKYTLGQAMVQGIALGVVAQLVVLLATVLSYVANVPTFFNAPEALNQKEAVGLGVALGQRAAGLVINPILASIAGAIGWILGAVLPAD